MYADQRRRGVDIVMIQLKPFIQALEERGVSFFTGVPDSLLKAFCAYVSENIPPERHVTAANEGGAVALATGHYLATGRPALVYMQNSGQGNAVNPLLSLADPDVYAIPMLMLVGWRGEPGVKDEPQHVKQGRVTQAIFDAMDIPCRILPAETDEAVAVVKEILDTTIRENRPVALLVQADSFEFHTRIAEPCAYTLKREDAIAAVVSCLPNHAVIVSTTGHISRELYEWRESTGQGHDHDFLTVGSMGHASQIAMGIALNRPEHPVVCLDGDGAVLMHMGALAIAGTTGLSNFHHVLLNNGVHDSVGGQKTAGFDVDFLQIAQACAYRTVARADNAECIQTVFRQMLTQQGPAFLEIRVAPGARKNLGRPTTTPQQNKQAFMQFMRSHDKTEGMNA